MWTIGDDANFTLPLNSGGTLDIIGKVTYVDNFEVSNVLQNRFIHGIVSPVPDISSISGTFSASFYQDSMTANVQYSGNIQYELRPATIQKYVNGLTKTYVMTKVNMTEKYYLKEKYTDESMRKLIQSSRKTTLTIKHSSNTIRSKSSQFITHAHLKILVLYTKQAVTACPGENCLLSQISLAIGNYNVALKNSLVNMTVSYVAERIQEYEIYREDSDMGVILSQMGTTISTNRRYMLGCHAVHLTTANSQYCGVGYYDFNGLTSGYSTSYFGCIGGYMSLAHEVGHNIGLQHDTSGYTGDTPNRGYCWDDASGKSNCHRSVMAYAGCVTPSGRTNCDRVKYFSSPNIQEMGSSIGTINFNNAQQLTNNIFNFLDQFTPYFPTSTPLSQSPTLSISTFSPSSSSSVVKSSNNITKTSIVAISVSITLGILLIVLIIIVYCTQYHTSHNKTETEQSKGNSKKLIDFYEYRGGNDLNSSFGVNILARNRANTITSTVTATTGPPSPTYHAYPNPRVNIDMSRFEEDENEGSEEGSDNDDDEGQTNKNKLTEYCANDESQLCNDDENNENQFIINHRHHIHTDALSLSCDKDMKPMATCLSMKTPDRNGVLSLKVVGNNYSNKL